MAGSKWPEGWVWPDEKLLGAGSEGRGDQGGEDVVELPGLGERGASKSPTPSPSPARSPFRE